MKKIKMGYNPYLREAMLEDGDQDSWLEEQNGKDFELWCAMWLVYLVGNYHDDIEIEFSGIERDCEIFEDSVVEFNQNASNFHT